MVYRDEDPTILVFGDSEAGITTACETALAHGGRVAAALPVAEAAERIDSQIAVDLVILDLRVDHGPVLDRLLRRIEEGAAENRFTSIIVITPELVDVTTARIEHQDVSVIVGPDHHVLSDAIARRLAPLSPQLRENGREMGGSQLTHAGNTDQDLAEATASGAIAADFSDVPERAMTWADGLKDFDPAVIRGIIRARRLRNEFFGAGLFADPAWDILLDLMNARVERRTVAVSSLCIAAAVPATTALRWIKQLTEMGLLQRVADPQDGRRVFIELTEDAIDKLTTYFNALIRGRGA